MQPHPARTLQSRARWFPLPAKFGAGSAVSVQLVQSPSVTYAYTCLIDARWATGQTLFSDRSIMWSWESKPGVQKFDPHNSLGTWSFERSSMFDPHSTAYYSEPIQIEQEWLDALSPPMPEASTPGNKLVMNSFEALLNQSGLPKASQHDDRYGTLKVEYETTLLFLNGLSRVGLSLQLEAQDPAGHRLRPELRPINVRNDTFNGGEEQCPTRNASGSFTRAHYQQYKYGTAWMLAKKGQYMSLCWLCTHVMLALAHIFAVCRARRSSESWVTLSELVVLAYNSAPQSAVFKNCGGGIHSLRTVEKKVRVGTRTLQDGSVQAELVVCGDEREVLDVVTDRAYS